MAKIKIQLPFMFNPRPYQINIFNAIASGQFKRGITIWHRRAGKEKTMWNLMINEANKKVGLYYYLFPTYAQGKKVLWDGMDKSGFAFLGHIPKECLAKKNETEMQILLKNGSIIQIVGTDKTDCIVGTNPIGCVFSEFSLQDPNAWRLLSPILRENGGWAIFNFTPRGMNHAYELYKMATKNVEWFAEVLSVEDTKAISAEDIQKERDDGMPEELIQQEYYCSFEQFMSGSYYSENLKKAREEKRIINLPYEKMLNVSTFWDLGISDYMSIWFMQQYGKEYRFIDYYEKTGQDISHYAKVLKDKPYVYSGHYLPHDAKVRELGTGKTRVEMIELLGIRPVHVVNRLPVADGINAVRTILNKCWFDKDKCQRGIECLSAYCRDYDSKAGIFKDNPKHDWASHGADAFRMFATSNKSSNRNSWAKTYEQPELRAIV